MTVNQADMYIDILKCQKCVALCRISYVIIVKLSFTSGSAHLNTNPNPNLCVQYVCPSLCVCVSVSLSSFESQSLPLYVAPFPLSSLFPLSCSPSPFHFLVHFLSQGPSLSSNYTTREKQEDVKRNHYSIPSCSVSHLL